MEISHADLPKITRMVLVEIGSVVMLSTGHTSSTGMLAVLADTTVAGGNMTATVEKNMVSWEFPSPGSMEGGESSRGGLLLAGFCQSSGHVCD